ncbi:MAG: hypothetical protein R3240_13720 [Gammaproteobacteria bacterium]|nr:hypothetical protein [Gammaproteobacteria bacterium]
MHKLQTGNPININKVTLVPIERTVIYLNSGKMGYWLNARKEVHAIIICDVNGIRVVALDACETSLEELVQTVPDLDSLLVTLEGCSMQS